MKIVKVINENKDVRTFFLDTPLYSKPGQFYMVWIPGVDEKPFALSYQGKKPAITVEKKGKATRALFRMKKGDELFLRGPYGNHFKQEKHACVVAGGLGIIPLINLIPKLGHPQIIYGARSKGNLLFRDRIGRASYCTDDGSFGSKGFTTEILEKKLGEKKIGIVYACGPEIMMKKVVDLCNKHKIKCQVSLERYMGCGIGICGSCACNDKLVCKDGPIFNSSQLKKMPDFGKQALLKSSRKVSLKEFFEWRG